MLFCRTKQVPDVHVKDNCHLTESIEIRLHNVSTPLANSCRVTPNLLCQPLCRTFLFYQYNLQAVNITLCDVTDVTRIIDVTNVTHISISLRLVQSYK